MKHSSTPTQKQTSKKSSFKSLYFKKKRKQLILAGVGIFLVLVTGASALLIISKQKQDYSTTPEESKAYIQESACTVRFTVADPNVTPGTCNQGTPIGNINDLGGVDAVDYSILLDNYAPKTITNVRADLSCDNPPAVNAVDYSILLDHYGET